MNFIPPSQFDAKLFLLASKLELEVIHVVTLFLDCLHSFDPKKVHMMLALMLDPRFKDLSILSNYARIENIIIATIQDMILKTLIPL
jgi:hypothetical protein